MGSVSEYRALQKKQVSEEFVNMINPFTDSASLEEAEQLAGFSIALPEKIENSTSLHTGSMFINCRKRVHPCGSPGY